MKLYEIKDERNRTVGYKATDETPTGEVEQTHTYSSVYYSAVMSFDFKSADDIIRGASELEYFIDEWEDD